MARQARTKNGHPPKTCPVCGLLFEWRKKWERDWDNVTYCSERCRRSRTWMCADKMVSGKLSWRTAC